MDKVIDSHCHIFPEEFSQNRAELSKRDVTFAELFSPVATGKSNSREANMATAETLVRNMDQCGVDRSIVMGLGWTDLDLAREANDYIIQSVARYPHRLVGFCSVNPSWGSKAAAEVERCWTAGLQGIGELHPDTQGFELDDLAITTPTMDLAYQLGIPVLIHTSEPVGHIYPGKGQTTPDKVCRFIENFPNNTIICAHWGGGLPFYALMPEVLKILKNVYFDSAASPFLYSPQIFNTVAKLLGADRILFATDFPLIQHRRAIAQVEEVMPPGYERDDILAGNAARLLGL